MGLSENSKMSMIRHSASEGAILSFSTSSALFVTQTISILFSFPINVTILWPLYPIQSVTTTRLLISWI